MVNKESILEKHLTSLINLTDNSYVSVEEMKKQPEWESTLNAMEEYAEEKLKYVINNNVDESCGVIHSTD